MSEQEPIVVPPVDDLRKQIVSRQAELRHLKKMLLLAKAVTESGEQQDQTATTAEVAT